MVKNKTISIVCLVSLLLATFLIQIGTSIAAITYPNGLMYYYKLNNDTTSGLNATDFINPNNEAYGKNIVGSEWEASLNTTYNKSIHLDGTDYLNTSINLSGKTAITIQALVRTDLIDANYRSFLGNEKGTGDGIMMRSDGHNDKLTCYMGTGAAYIAAVANSITQIGSWDFVTCIFNSSGVYMYINTTLQTTSAAGAFDQSDVNAFMIGYGYQQSEWDGYIDEVRIWNFSLLPSNITDFFGYQLGVSDVIPDTTSPTITYVSQNPSDLNTTNIINNPLKINYTVTDTSGVDNNSVKLYYKMNDTSSNTQYYQNGTAYSGFFVETTRINTSNTFMWTLRDNEILSGVYNTGVISIDNKPHSSSTTANLNNYYKTEYYNVSGLKKWGYFEIMANSTAGANPSRAYYCNSSYTTGDITTSAYCSLIGTRTATTVYDHCHLNQSCHIGFPFTVNTTSKTIGTVGVTPQSYFMFGGAKDWNVFNISDQTRVGMTQTTGNKGGSWTTETYTIDQHIHQFSTGAINSSFYYYVCANDTLGNSGCSAVRTDFMELGNLPPSAPSVYNPTASSYTGLIAINYTQSYSPNGYDILFYNISLLNPNFSFNKTIVSNNSLNLSYLWNSNETQSGNYFIRVEVRDTQGQNNFGYSENFTILNVAISSVLNSSIGDTSAIITWLTNIISNSSVSAGISSTNLSINATNTTAVTSHRVNLTGLSASYLYYYNITSCDSFGNCNSTGIYSFTTTSTDTACGVTHENCDALDATYDVEPYTNRWVSSGACEEKEQKLRERRDYSCNVTLLCGYVISFTQWSDTGERRDVADNTSCDDGDSCTVSSFCTSGVCGGGITPPIPTIFNVYVNGITTAGANISWNTINLSNSTSYIGTSLNNLSIMPINVSMVTEHRTSTTTLPAGVIEENKLYYFNVTSCNGCNCNSTGTYTFNTDFTNPIVSLISPTNNTINNSQNTIFTYSIIEANPNNCSLYIDGYINQTNTTITNGTRTFNITGLTDGTHIWSILCSDIFNRTSQTGNYNLIIDTTAPTMTIVSPSNNSKVGYAENATFNFLAVDTNSIYKIQSNISYPNGTLVFTLNYTNSGSNVGSVRLNNTKKFEFYQNGKYTIVYEVCDGTTTSVTCISAKTYFDITGTGVDVYAVNNLTDTPINDFFATLYVGTNKIYKNTTTGKIEFNVSNGNYTILVNVTGYGIQNLSAEVIGHINKTASFFIANSIYFRVKDEETQLNLTNVAYELIGATYGNFTTATGLIFQVLNPGTYALRYTSAEYNTRTYYFTLDEGYNVVSSLYLLNGTAIFTNISVFVYDEGGDVVKEAYVKALKYDLTTNTYIQVDMCKTNQQGFCYLALQKFVEYYEFIVDYNSQTKIITSPNYIIADTLQIRISLGTIAGADYDKQHGIYKSLETVETGVPYFRYTYSDPLNVMSSACLYVYQTTVTGQTLVNTSCLSTPSGTIVVYPVNTSNMTYRADAFGFINDKYIWFDTDYYSFETVLAINQYGIFIVIILTLIFIFIGLWSPSLMLVLTPLPLIIGKVLGIVSINLPALIGMEFVAIVIAFIISEKQVSSG